MHIGGRFIADRTYTVFCYTDKSYDDAPLFHDNHKGTVKKKIN